MLETVFLDAGGVLVFPNWSRISAALGSRGVAVSPEALAAADPHAKRQLDLSPAIQTTNDAGRGWLYFNLILNVAGVPRSAATDAALEELHAYHQQSNLWELLPPDVLPALTALRARGLKLTVVSNANGRLSALLDRLRVASCFDCVLDSHDEGVEKPDPRFFEIALERSGARPETTIHVGDLYQVDVLGARSAGLRGVLLDQAGLYEEVDCPRVRSLSGLVDEIARGAFD
ncbi:MAG: hypothetical protein A3H96_15275 [Acidobacteria bacterium RIFCSPLOWO2_02_FULL_67_36]|nr:MAG: hypothetical protein A3H96_15275 [Acidobacteria bacterium RIFCSPLOWO2_02_FULL_67_36]OFW20915.1 MAG: hypothetical protein A3G21_20490 [Acidobacteria bacterium RIFCSPLOWO2_12_FULL_66_21]